MTPTDRKRERRIQDAGPARWTTTRWRGNTQAAVDRFYVDTLKRQRRAWIRAAYEGRIAGERWLLAEATYEAAAAMRAVTEITRMVMQTMPGMVAVLEQKMRATTEEMRRGVGL